MSHFFSALRLGFYIQSAKSKQVLNLAPQTVSGNFLDAVAIDQ
jgi:hypothetical protein